MASLGVELCGTLLPRWSGSGRATRGQCAATRSVRQDRGRNVPDRTIDRKTALRLGSSRKAALTTRRHRRHGTVAFGRGRDANRKDAPESRSGTLAWTARRHARVDRRARRARLRAGASPECPARPDLAGWAQAGLPDPRRAGARRTRDERRGAQPRAPATAARRLPRHRARAGGAATVDAEPRREGAGATRPARADRLRDAC